MRFLIVLFVLMLSACSSNQLPGNANDTKKAANKTWIGSWERRLWQNEATLEIKSIKGDSLEFVLSASNGGNTGELEGVAIAKNNVASFLSVDASYSCSIEFTLIADSIIGVNQKTGTCSAGMGVLYSGEYKNSKL